jgi:membrane-associated phospholipid phosphatase
MIRNRLAALALACALPLSNGRAADALSRRPSYDLSTDVAVTAVAAGGTLGLLLLKNDLAPPACRWCNPPGFDADVTRALAWSNRDAASTASDLLEVALGAGVLGNALLDGYRRGDREAGFANALLITEATSIAMFLDYGVKYAVGRSRPYVWLGRTGSGSRDGNLSFFSGHTTFAFAVAASSSTLLLSQHAPGAEVASVVAFAGAGLVGYLRIAAEQHYLTDVLAGAAVGTLVGWAVPHFFHAPREGGLALRPMPGGISIAW